MTDVRAPTRDVIFAASIADGPLEAAPIPPEWVIEGAPTARTRRIATSRDGQTRTAIWECTAGRFRWHFGADETLYVIDGAVEVTHPDGTVRTLRAGDAAYFPAGVTSDWHVAEYVMKLSFLHAQASLLRRVARRVPLARAVDRLRLRLRDGY